MIIYFFIIRCKDNIKNSVYMSKIITYLITTLFLISCGGEGKDVTKKTINDIEMDEDTLLEINVLNFLDHELKSSRVSKIPQEINVELEKNKIKIEPKKDVFGEYEINIEGEDINGKNNLLVLNLKVNNINDVPRLTNENIKIDYKDGKEINSNIFLYDIEKDIKDIDYKIIKNNKKIELIIKNEELIFKAKELGIKENIIYELEFNDNGIIQRKNINVNFNYTGDGIPLTNDSLLNIELDEDNEYIGKIEPIRKYENQTFKINYITDQTLGNLVILNEFEYKYIPNNNFYGKDKFYVTIENNDGEKVTNEINISVNQILDEFKVSDILGSVEEDGVYEGVLKIEDPELESSYEVIYNNENINGELNIINNKIIYIPNENFYGYIDQNLVIKETKTNRLSVFNFKMDVISKLDPLIIKDKEITIIRGYQYEEKFTFIDPEESNFYYSTIQPNEGSVSINNSTGEYIYNSDINGSLSIDSFKIIVLDSENRRTSEANVIVKIIDKENEVIKITVNEDEVLNNIDIPVIKEGDENNFNVSFLTNPQNGTTNFSLNKKINYFPNVNFNGIDQFTIRVTDSNTAYFVDMTYEVTVIDKGDLLDFSKLNYSQSLKEDSVLEVDLTVVDQDKDGSLIYSIDVLPEHGNVEIINGLLIYTPNTDYNGEDFVAINFNKNNPIINETKVFNIHVIEQEDDLYLTEDINLNMYGSSYKEINVKDLVVNNDNENVYFLGDRLDNEDWIIDSIYMNAKINRETGLLKIEIFDNVEKDQVINFSFRIKEENSGTVWYFDGQINILDNLKVINSLNIEEINTAEINTSFLFCGGDFELGNEEVVLSDGIKLFGSDFIFENPNDVNLKYKCQSQEESKLILNNKLKITSNNEISGFNIISKSSSGVISRSDYSPINENILIKKNNFFSDIDEDFYLIDFSIGNFDNLTIEENIFNGFNNLEKKISGIKIRDVINNLNIKNNEFNFLKNAILIEKLKQESNFDKDLYVKIGNNYFEDSEVSIRIKDIEAVSSISQIIEIYNNQINNSNIGIKFDKANLLYTYQPDLNILINNNFITNSKEKAITFNNENKMTGFYNVDVNIEGNIITVFDGLGIELIETMILNDYIYIYSHNVSITDNEIQPVNNSIKEENTGILYKIDYYNNTNGGKDFNIDSSFNFSKILNINIERNKIGNIKSSFKFKDSAILITREENNNIIEDSINHKTIFNIYDNDVYGNNDLTVDHNKLNVNKDNIILNIERNIFRSVYPKYSFKINEKQTNLCLKFIDNSFDFINLINDDNENSVMEIIDPNNIGINLFYDNQTSYGNVIVSEYEFLWQNDCY